MLRPPSSGTGGIAPGARFGAYVVDALLGRGGMGAVYRVRHAETASPYALKVLLDGRLDGDRAVARFRREVEVLARIDAHPGIVRVHACGVERGVPWCAMDLVEGRSLAARLRDDGPLPPREAATLVADVARALAHAHAHGVLHRDLKPENVLVDPSGRPCLVDFGLAYDVLAERLTRTGELLGTPAFMAPEQVSRGSRSGTDDARPAGGGIGPATDVYGAGAVLYAALTGRAPFVGGDGMALVVQVVQRAPDPPRRLAPGVPPELEAVCLRCLEKAPADRYAHAADLVADLERWLRGEPVRARAGSFVGRMLRRWRRPDGRRRLLAAGAVVLALAVAAVAVAVTALARTGGAASPVEELARAERDLDAGATVTPAAARALVDAEELAREPALRRRAELVALLAGLAATPDDGAIAPALGAMLRPDGRPDPALAVRCERALVRAGRLALLARVLHGARPFVAASGVAAPALARAIADEQGLPATAARTVLVPDDDAAFAALHRADGLDEPARGRLLLARAAAVTAAGAGDEAARIDRALDLVARARARHGVLPAADALPAAALARARARLPGIIVADEPRIAWAMGEVVAAAASGVPSRLPADVVASLQGDNVELLVANSGTTGRVGSWGEQTERQVRTAAFLDRFDVFPFASKQVKSLRAGMGDERIVALAEVEMARPTTRRDPAALLFLAWVALSGREASGAGPAPPGVVRWVREAAAIGPDEVWLHVRVAERLASLDLVDEALAPARRALELDRRRAPIDRCPLCGQVVLEVEARLRAAGALAAAPIEERVALGLEAARVQLGVRPRSDELKGAHAVESWTARCGDALGYQLRDIAGELVGAGEPRCCGSGENPSGGRAGVDELVAVAVAIGPSEATGADLLRVRARHHERHGRLAAAVDDLAESVRWERRRENEDADYTRGMLTRVAATLDDLARLDEALGRAADAATDREEAARCRERAAAIR